MALPLPIRFLVLSVFSLQTLAPTNLAFADEAASTTEPASPSREPAAASTAAQEAEYSEMMTPSKVELDEVVEEAAKKTVEYSKKFKTGTDILNEFKSRIKEADQKVLLDYIGDLKTNVPLKISYANKKMSIRLDGGKVIAFNFSDVENYKIQIDGSVIDISPLTPLADQLSAIEAAVLPKFKSASRLDLLFPQANAVVAGAAAGVAATGLSWTVKGLIASGVLGTAYLGAVWGRDQVNEEWLERNLKVINLANATCQKYQDREMKTVYKTYTVKKKTRRHRRSSFRYVEYERATNVEMGPREVFNREMKALVAARGERPSEEGEAQRDWDQAAKQLKDRFDGARLSRGSLPVAPRVLDWSKAIKSQMCAGKATRWGVAQGISVKGFWTDEDDDEADDVLSFDSLCTRSKELEACLDELNGKSRLSETGNRHLREILEKSKIGKSFRRANSIPIRTQKAESVD